MRRLLIIADDLAGAADCAVAFAERGLRTCAVLDAEHAKRDEWDVLALDSDTRDAPATIAGARAGHLASLAEAEDEIFKKVDSTLRGNLATELAAIFARRPADCVVAAPAFPAAGRTTVNGRQLLDGSPLEESEFAALISSSWLRELLAPAGLPIVELELEQIRAGGAGKRFREADAPLVVCDAETDEDLDQIVRGALDSGKRLMWLGSAGLARRLATLAPSRSRCRSLAARAAPVLLVVGSPAAATRAQLQTLRASAEVQELLAGGEAPETQIDALRACLRAGRDCALTLAGRDRGRGHGRDGTALLASVAAAGAEFAGGLVLTGGETARAVLQAMSVTGLRLEREIQPGIPLGFTEDARRLPVMIKAGGFGDRDALLACRKAIRESAPDRLRQEVR